MTEEEITTLAREYAEEMAKGPEFEELSDGMKENVLALNTVYVAEVIHWLCERFCLVEKEVINNTYRKAIEQGKHAHIKFQIESRAKLRLLQTFFPEIAKVNEEK